MKNESRKKYLLKNNIQQKEYFISEDVNKYYLYIINCLKEEKKNKNIKKIVRNLI